jgi:mannose-6-phosphate isomerase
LTPKHVDVPELLRILDFAPREAPVLEPGQVPGAETYRYPAPAAEFTLDRVELTPGRPEAEYPLPGPRIALATSGAVEIRCGGQRGRLRAGEAAWIPADEPAPVLALDSAGGADAAQVFVATTDVADSLAGTQ